MWKQGLLTEIIPSAFRDHWFLRLRNKRLHENRYELPQLFLSGELHGNEPSRSQMLCLNWSLFFLSFILGTLFAAKPCSF